VRFRPFTITTNNSIRSIIGVPPRCRIQSKRPKCTTPDRAQSTNVSLKRGLKPSAWLATCPASHARPMPNGVNMGYNGRSRRTQGQRSLFASRLFGASVRNNKCSQCLIVRPPPGGRVYVRYHVCPSVSCLFLLEDEHDAQMSHRQRDFPCVDNNF